MKREEKIKKELIEILETVRKHKDLEELEKEIENIKKELEKNLKDEDKNLLLTLMDLQNIKLNKLCTIEFYKGAETIGKAIEKRIKSKRGEGLENANNKN